MTKVFLYCDESGAKGYADQDEAYPGEIGVFAGIMVPEERLAMAKPAFDQVASRYTPASGKLHIADLAPGQQEAMRNELFAVIKNTNLPCFWYSIHVAGLHAHHQTLTNLLKQQREAFRTARGEAEPRIKGRSPREEPESMHVQLFSGLYSHLVAFLVERGRQGIDVEIRTDQVDTPLVKRFTEVAEELLDNDPTVATTTGFDTIEKKVVTGSVTTTVRWPSDLDFSPLVNSLSIDTVPDSDGLVLAADVLANSLNYLFKHRDADALYGPLNCKDAVAKHPLAAQLDTFINWGSGDIVGDGIYRHPKGRQ
ncbi:hypothetical protein [Burkholderia gladioli]|uniref:hypothetical protein n=1 Tax=Burkholderia gladioli TaxID=28095 RepID=UPI00163EDD42|nr:hypothetical protein [Burkholderia gladioli]